MIYLYSGTPGSGKSSDAVRFIKKYLYKRDGLVIYDLSI
nr:MAG TPA: IstB-like ATP binding protein [Inoviridae sp.]